MIDARATSAMHGAHASPPAPRAVRRRWLVAGIAIVLVLGSYAGALAWVARRLEVDVQKSIHAVPVARSGQPLSE